MGMKRASPLALYRAAPAINPAAILDESILAAARAANTRPYPRSKLLACAVAATMAAVFAARWMSPGDLAARAPSTREFGSLEGQDRVYLTTLDLADLNLKANAGPGSQEGLP